MTNELARDVEVFLMELLCEVGLVRGIQARKQSKEIVGDYRDVAIATVRIDLHAREMPEIEVDFLLTDEVLGVATLTVMYDRVLAALQALGEKFRTFISIQK